MDGSDLSKIGQSRSRPQIWNCKSDATAKTKFQPVVEMSTLRLRTDFANTEFRPICFLADQLEC